MATIGIGRGYVAYVTGPDGALFAPVIAVVETAGRPTRAAWLNAAGELLTAAELPAGVTVEVLGGQRSSDDPIAAARRLVADRARARPDRPGGPSRIPTAADLAAAAEGRARRPVTP